MKGFSSLMGAVTVILVVVVVVPAPAVLGQTPSQCTEEKNKLKNTCRSMIFGLKPSAECCRLIRAAHIECVCPFVTPKLIAALGGAQRVVRLVDSCGRIVRRNTKCGSMTFPP